MLGMCVKCVSRALTRRARWAEHCPPEQKAADCQSGILHPQLDAPPPPFPAL